MKFDFSKSNDSDFQNKFQYIYTRLDKQLELARYNLELTQRLLKHYEADKGIQRQVDEYFEETEHETSPQTDSDEQGV